MKRLIKMLMAFALTPLMAYSWTLNDGLNYSSSPVVSGGDLDWVPQYTTLFDNALMCKSGAITDDQETWCQTTVEGPCVVSFLWKVSCESGFDYLQCLVDDQAWDSISGEMGWCEEKLNISNGTHTVKWKYSKDRSGSEGEDCGYVAQFKICDAGGYPASSGGFVIDSGVLKGWNGGGKDIVFPNGVVEIDGNFMQFNREMQTLTCPTSLRRIGASVFLGCSSVTNIFLNDGLEIIGSQSFTALDSLLDLRIPDSVNTIEYAAFWGCNSLTNVVFPASLKILGWGTFDRECGSLRTVYFRSDAPELTHQDLAQWFAGTPKDMVIYVPTGSIGWFGETDTLTKKKWPNGDADAREIQNYYMDGFVQWKDRSSTATLDANGGDCEVQQITVLKSGCVGTLPVAIRSGYEFLGWFTSEEGGMQVTEVTDVPDDVTWYAQWRTIEYGITYSGLKGAGHSNPERYTVEDSITFGCPDVVAGYRFTGWSPSAIVAGSTGTMTVVANWSSIAYSITYVETMDAENVNPQTYTIEDAITFSALSDVEGWNFVGWSITGIEQGTTGDLKVTAIWEKKAPTYGPWGESEDVANPDKLGPTYLQDLTLTIDGAAAAQGDVVAVFRGDTGALCGLGKVLGDTNTLTVVCYAPEGVMLSFKVWVAASGIVEPTIIDGGESCAFVAPASGSFVTDRVLALSTVPPKNVVRIAKPKAAVGLVYSGESLVGILGGDERLSCVGSFTATNAGIYTVRFALPSENETEAFSWADDTTNACVVEWTIAPLDISDARVTSGDIPDQIATGTAVTPAVEMAFGGTTCVIGEDYTLSYTNNVEVGTGRAIVTGVGNFTGVRELEFAIVAPEPDKFTVAFDACGGYVGETARQVTDGTALGALPTAQRMGYDFGGWFVVEDGVSRKVTEADIVTGDVTVTAQWTAIAYAIVYELGEGATNNVDNPPAYTIEDDIVLQDPGRPGFTFLGWSPDDGVITNGTVGAKTFAALWESIPEPKHVYGVGAKCEIRSGLIGYAVKNLPKGLKYDKKTGVVSGVPTAATSGKVVATFTKKGEETQTIEFEVAALPSGATGTFNGFVVSGVLGEGALPSDVSSPASSETVNAGSLQVTVSDVGKIAAKIVAAAGTYSFTATGWDSVSGGVYSVRMTTKMGDVLTLSCDSTAAWNAHQLTGSFTAASGGQGLTALLVEAQKNAFGKQWFFNATGDDASGWTLSFAENAKAAALTVALNADGKTSVAGKLGAYKINASGFADVSGIGNGAIFADFAPIVTVGKNKKSLSLRANLWFDKKDNHEEGVGSAVFVP